MLASAANRVFAALNADYQLAEAVALRDTESRESKVTAH